MRVHYEAGMRIDISAAATAHELNSRVHNATDRICEVCRGAINNGAGRFRVGETEYHPNCFRFWLTVPVASRTVE
jgi:hypothetical protein